jgi:NitT/TauT family transport system permease protein
MVETARPVEPIDLPVEEEPTPVRPRRRRRSRGRRRALEITLSLLVLVAMLGAWQLFIEVRDLSSLVLPTPAEVGAELVEVFRTGYIWDHLWITLQEVILGFAFGTVLGVGLAVLLSQSAMVMRVANPYIIASQAAPKLALAPIFALWFGFGITSKVVIAGLIAFFPLLENTLRGLGRVDADFDDLFRTMRASKRQRFFKLQWPNALPYVFTGMRVAMILAVVGAVVGEYVGANQGLGALIISSQGSFRTDLMFAVIVILTVIGILLYKAVELAERAYMAWTYRTLPEEPE